MNSATELAALFLVVFALNVIPAFAPPTWMALSWVGFNRPLSNPFVVAFVGALAATAGRVILAKLSHSIIHQRFLSDAMRANIEVIRVVLDRHRTITFGGVLAYAFSPLPSNYVFIAYGLTSLPLWLVTVPFFIGRCVSYSFFVFTASVVSEHLDLESSEAQPYFGIYFVVSQILFLGLVIMFTRIDWHYLITARRIRWLQNTDLP